MVFGRLRFAVTVFGALFALALTTCVSGQTTSSMEDVFTISVAAGTSSKDVQVRYFLTDQSGHAVSSTAAQGDGNTIVIKTDGAKSLHSFKGIAYAPGCQFVTFNVSDLAASDRHGDFQCQPLSSTPLQGSVPSSELGLQSLQVEALYDAEWARDFFNISNGATSPFSLGSTSVAADGTFTINLPVFTGDPTWASLSHSAGFMFYLKDASGKTLGRLTSSEGVAHGSLQVADSYPAVVTFDVQSPHSR